MKNFKSSLIAAAVLVFMTAAPALAGYDHDILNPAYEPNVDATAFTDDCSLLADDVTNGRPIFIDCDLLSAVVDINGGAIDGAIIGANSAAAGTFTDLTATGETIMTGEVNLGAVSTFTDSDATPDVSGAAYWNTNTTGVTITDFDGTGLSDGDVIVVVSKGAIVYDVTSSGILGGTTDITTASGDVTTFLYDGTDWHVIARIDVSDDLN